jgi:16S rRNA C967 or C1407 C5-methylase (RsmB/RsmF family)
VPLCSGLNLPSVAGQQSEGETEEASSPVLFDKVLVDAPCSGTGVLAKRADMRWKRGEASLAQLCRLQVRCGRGRQIELNLRHTQPAVIFASISC